MSFHAGEDGLWRDLARATDFALTIHADQTRKGSGAPYISHLLGVTSLILEYGGDEEQAIAGLLHDAIEDQGAHQDAEIAKRFGANVAALVRACSDTDVTPKPPWRDRKVAFIDSLPTTSPRALLIVIADRLHNVRSLITDLRFVGSSIFDRFNGGMAGTLWYYQAISDALSALAPGPASAELAAAVRELEKLAGAVAGGASAASPPSL